MFTKTMLPRDTCLLMVERLREMRPKLAVEFGSGFSTGLIALYADEFVSFDNSAKHKAPWPCVKVVPVAGGTYVADLPDGIEFALIDGPLARVHGRQGTFPTLWPHLAPTFEVWVDDYIRSHEKKIVAAWKSKYPITVEHIRTEKGLAIIRRKDV